MSNWVAVASEEHVRKGRKAGFMQVCHRKIVPLKRINGGDCIIYYSPTLHFQGKDKLQAFTAFGTATQEEPYQVDMGNGFCPYRRNVIWSNARETLIKPLIQHLEFSKYNRNRGYQLRFGLFLDTIFYFLVFMDYLFFVLFILKFQRRACTITKTIISLK